MSYYKVCCETLHGVHCVVSEFGNPCLILQHQFLHVTYISNKIPVILFFKTFFKSYVCMIYCFLVFWFSDFLKLLTVVSRVFLVCFRVPRWICLREFLSDFRKYLIYGIKENVLFLAWTSHIASWFEQYYRLSLMFSVCQPCYIHYVWFIRGHSGYGLSQWEVAFLCNAFSHWPSA